MNATDVFTIPIPNRQGICLSKYGEPGYGEMVKTEKYASVQQFGEKLLQRSEEILEPFIEEHEIKYLTWVPSFRSGIVKDFAIRLAARLKIACIELLRKVDGTYQQKQMENSTYQCLNALRSFSLTPCAMPPEKILLIDDLVDSRWTFTVCGYYLTQAGCKEVYPFALADSSKEEI
jgi:ATP-dependent DNA helicase RecQ